MSYHRVKVCPYCAHWLDDVLDIQQNPTRSFVVCDGCGITKHEGQGYQPAGWQKLNEKLYCSWKCVVAGIPYGEIQLADSNPEKSPQERKIKLKNKGATS